MITKQSTFAPELTLAEHAFEAEVEATVAVHRYGNILEAEVTHHLTSINGVYVNGVEVPAAIFNRLEAAAVKEAQEAGE